MRINWFSPLPPAATGVAEFAAHALPALCDRAEVVVWTDQERVEGLAPRAEVRRYHPDAIPWKELNRADISVYHLGNNQEHHAGPWLVSRRSPGIVVLHDVRLPHFFINLYRQRLHDREGYLALMERVYGLDGREVAEGLWSFRVPETVMTEHFPLTEMAVGGALGALVHTPGALEELRPHQRWPLVYQPLAYRRPTATIRPAPARGPYRLIIFGYIGMNRQLEQVLEALAGFPERERFQLHVYGSLWDPKRYQALAVRPELRSCVTLHGFVPDNVLERALSEAHLAINLRYPTMGEGSISQLRIWEHALPSLVSDVGWYATLPPETVAFVRPGHEVADLRRHLQEFLRDPTAFRRRGEQGRRYLVEHHSPEQYAATLLALCAEGLVHRRRSLGYYLAERAGRELSLWCADGREVARPVAEQITRLVA